jgi:hypothetical protein
MLSTYWGRAQSVCNARETHIEHRIVCQVGGSAIAIIADSGGGRAALAACLNLEGLLLLLLRGWSGGAPLAWQRAGQVACKPCCKALLDNNEEHCVISIDRVP